MSGGDPAKCELQASRPRRVWHLPEDVDTDSLAPGVWMHAGIEELAQHCLESLCPEFASAVEPGDLIVAGTGFGMGSSREQAVGALIQLGVGAVIAPRFGGLFFRNAFNLGLLLLTCDDVSSLRSQTHLCLDPQRFTLTWVDGTPVTVQPIPDFLQEMIRQGGLLNTLRTRQALSPNAMEKLS